MPRPPRLAYPDTWYHIMNRASDKKFIFDLNSIPELFLNILSETTKKFYFEIHAYCLMSNHYHLLLHTKDSNISKIMQHINGIFTRRYNKITKSDGPIFRGRFISKIVNRDSYLLPLTRYIHLNPVEAGMVMQPEQYPWSSFKYYLNPDDRPNWLTCNIILEYFTPGQEINEYKKFVVDKSV